MKLFKKKKTKGQIQRILTAGIVITLGLLFFKYLPMEIWGWDILFDASAHVASSLFILYILWFFIDQNKHWRTPFFLFCVMVLTIISLQRIFVNAHNDIGLLGGLVIGLVAIGIAEWRNVKKRLKF